MVFWEEENNSVVQKISSTFFICFLLPGRRIAHLGDQLCLIWKEDTCEWHHFAQNEVTLHPLMSTGKSRKKNDEVIILVI